jgi:hypothetical protein
MSNLKVVEASSILLSAFLKANLKESEAAFFVSNEKSEDEIRKLILSLSKERSDKKVTLRILRGNSYPQTYRVKPVREQVDCLRAHFPQLSTVFSGETQSLTPAEGTFAIPRWSLIARTYPQAVLKVLEAIAISRNNAFENIRASEMGSENIKQTGLKSSAIAEIARSQNFPDIILLSAQFGARYNGISVRESRKSFTKGEFGLGIFEIAVMLLTHPERLNKKDDLGVSCPGDDFSNNGDRKDKFAWNHAPYFLLHGSGKLRLGATGVHYPRKGFGSATAFIP